MGGLTNPLLDEINGLSPAAKAALMAAHGTAAATQPPAAPSVLQPPSPAMASIRAQAAPQGPAPPPMLLPPSQQPAVPAMGGSAPTVKGPRGTLEADQAHLSGVMSKPAALENVYGKIAGSGFGQAHPVAGKILGGLAQIPSTLADVALSGVAPRVGALVPGTTAQRSLQIGAGNKQVTQDEANREKEAQTAEIQARTGAIANPPDRTVPLPTDQGYQAYDPKTGKATPIQGPGGEPLQPYEKPQPVQHAVLPDGSVVAISRDPKTGAVSADEVFKGDGKSKPTITKLEINGKPHNVLVDENTGKTIQDLGETGEKPPTVNVNAGIAGLDRELTHFGKPYETAVTAGSSQLEKIAEARAMINGNAEAQALGIPKVMTALVSGQGSGVRITQAELNMIAHARGIQGDFEGFVNKLSGKGQLTGEQKQQIIDVLDQAASRLQVKQQIANETLDKINGASSRQEIIQADKEARQKLGDYEKTGHFTGQTIALKNGKQVTVTAVHPDGSFDAN
jgi:hypothetical protein